MAGYFTVTIIWPPPGSLKALTGGEAVVTTEVVSGGGCKGTVTLDYTCEATGSGDDPELSKTTDSVFIDNGTDGSSSVKITGDPGQVVELTVEGTHPTCGYDTDSKTITLGS